MTNRQMTIISSHKTREIPFSALCVLANAFSGKVRSQVDMEVLMAHLATFLVHPGTGVHASKTEHRQRGPRCLDSHVCHHWS
jgi:hypothetical protein